MSIPFEVAIVQNVERGAPSASVARGIPYGKKVFKYSVLETMLQVIPITHMAPRCKIFCF